MRHLPWGWVHSPGPDTRRKVRTCRARRGAPSVRTDRAVRGAGRGAIRLPGPFAVPAIPTVSVVATQEISRPAAPDPEDGGFLSAEHYRRQLETIAQNATLALFIMDERQHCTYMNPAAERLTGYTLAEVEGKALHDYVHHTRPDGSPYPLEECPIDRAFPQNMREQGEEVFVHKDGHFYPVAFTASPIRDGDRTVGTIIEARDITQELREREELIARDRESALSAAVGTTLTRGGTLRGMLQGCAEAVAEHLDAAFARVWTLNEAEQVLELQASAGMYTHLDGPHGRVPVGAFKIGKIAQEKQPHLTNDVLHDPRVGDKEWARREGMVAFAGYPLVVEDRVVGVLAMFARHALAERTLGALGAIADGIALAISRSRAEEERERLMAALEVERARLTAIFQRAPAFICTLRGPDHVFEMANPPYYQLVGHREILGKPVAEALPEVVEQGFVGLLDQVYRSGEPFIGTEVRVLLQREAGGRLEERFLNFVYQPLPEVDGTITGILAHGVDVTELVESRRRVEEQAAELEAQTEELQVQALQMEEVQAELEISNEELQHANEEADRERARLEAVIEHAPVGILIAEAPSGRIVRGNRRVEEIFRHPMLYSEEIGAYRDWVAFHPDGRRVEGHDYPLARVLATGEPAGPDEYLYRRGDDTLGWVQITGVPIRDEGGEVTGGVVVIDDVDAEKRAVEEREGLIRALDAERSRLREVFMQAPALIAVLRGPEHVFELANAPYLQLVGNRDVVGKSIREAIPEVEGQGYFEMLDQVYASGQAVVGNESHALLDRHGDGRLEEGYFNFVFQPLRDPGGAVDGILIHAVEVTEQVRARNAVESLEERLRLAVDAADVGIYDWDTASPVLNWDARTRRVFGVREEGDVTFDDFVRVLHPDDHDAASAAIQAAMDPAGNGAFATEYRVIHEDGAVRWVRAVGQVYFGGEGAGRKPVRFVGTVQDVTERRLAEAERERLIAELETGRARLQQIFTEAPAVMALYTGPEHVISVVNPTWVQTVGKPDAVGRPFREVFPEFEGTGLFEILDRIYETGEPFVNPEVNVPLERWGSGVREDTWWNLVWRPLAGDGVHGRDILVHAVEVTEQVRARHEVERKAEELGRLARQLEASNRELDQFAYVASHDLKAPLRGIANLASWIEEDLGEEVKEDTREHLELLRGRVHRMEGLIDGVLQYSRAGRVRDEPEPVDVGALLHEVVDLLAPPEHVEVRVADGMPRLLTERLPLQQVFMNLIGNALKYNSSPEPRVWVEARDLGQAHEFSVSDNGPGIAPEYHDRIFGIFQTLQARDKVEGTGIGLSLVKKLVESRGGTIRVESAEGAGATFRFTWPGGESHG